MKIKTLTPVKKVNISFVRLGEPTEYLCLENTTLKEVERACRDAIVLQEVNPFFKGLSTRINIREAVKGVNGKSKSISFKGLSPAKTKDVIASFIKSQN
jgi:hypothetical protein